MFKGADHGADWVVAALFEGAKNAHQDGLAVGSAVAAVAIAVFADDDRRTDGAFGVVVVERNARLIQGGEQIVLMRPQKLDRTPSWKVLLSGLDHLLGAVKKQLSAFTLAPLGAGQGERRVTSASYTQHGMELRFSCGAGL